MSLDYCFTFSAVEMSVRYGDGDCNTRDGDIINCYVHMGLARAKSHSCIAAVQHGHMRVINTLIDAMCDHCLSSVWRQQCYRYIKRFLPLLYEMLDPQQYQQKVQEIQTLHTYYFEDNHSKYQPTCPEQSRQLSVKKRP
jgi:hypothetical protein